MHLKMSFLVSDSEKRAKQDEFRMVKFNKHLRIHPEDIDQTNSRMVN
jgi:hypothetical protein